LADRPGEGGAVVITLFACRTLRDVLLIWWLHFRLKPAVWAHAPGFLGVKLYIDWRQRLVRSVTLWSTPAGVYDMGEVREHVAATRIPRWRGIRTACGIYTYQGECMAAMFGGKPRRNRLPHPLVTFPGPHSDPAAHTTSPPHTKSSPHTKSRPHDKASPDSKASPDDKASSRDKPSPHDDHQPSP